LVLGIIATVCPFLFFIHTNFIVFAIPLAVLALLVGMRARRRALKGTLPTGVATAGVALGVVSILLSTVMLFVYKRGADSSKDFAGDRIKNSKEFDDLFNKAVQQDNKEKK
jgi:uncharacterized membrane protein (DUF485 family)